MLISFCTVCKNRAGHYKQTIIKNIEDNPNDTDREFILLDYNSDDDLEQWVKTNLARYIKSGVLTYYKTFDPPYFQRSHSRNMAFRLAQGDLLCNVDADNFTGAAFSSYLEREFHSKANLFMCPGGQFDQIAFSDIGGRICIRKEDFFKVGGYDEAMSNYGFEDFDLINRLEIAGLQKKLITDTTYFEIIPHETVDRIKEEFPYKNIERVMVHYISPSTSIILLIFLNKTFALATIVNQRNLHSADRTRPFDGSNNNLISIDEGNWTIGNTESTDSGRLELFPKESGCTYILSYTENDNASLYNLIDHVKIDLYRITHDKSIEQAIQFFSETHNRSKMEWNLIQKIANPNNGAIGCGVVYKNFDYTNPIIL